MKKLKLKHELGALAVESFESGGAEERGGASRRTAGLIPGGRDGKFRPCRRFPFSRRP